MSHINKEQIVQFLKIGEFGYYGMLMSEEKTSNEESIELVSIVAYVLSKMQEINMDEKEMYKRRILKGKSETGAFFTINKKMSVWATSQACLALNEMGCELSKFEDSIIWLCENQNEDGGWSYDGIFQSSSIIHSFYTVIILKKLRHYQKRIDNVLRKNINYLKIILSDLHEKTTTRLIALYLLDVLGEKNQKATTEMIIIAYIKEIIERQTDEVYLDFDSEHYYQYYIGFYFPAAYLLLRRFIPPYHLFVQFLIKHLLITVEQNYCWRPNMANQKPMSWTTALSLYTVFVWERDCLNNNCNYILLDKESILNKLNMELENTDMRNDFIINCPLNYGKCNLKSKIQLEYSDKNVFLDIPYNVAYEDYEKQIVHTLKDGGLIPVLAKDSTQSNILLCKVCQKIQCCKYGIADISEAKSNVYFELGMLYGINKKCAILKNANTNLPTDLQGKEYIEYVNTRELGEKLTQWIRDNVG